tara:strand:+ start:2521 stop:3321 length:801 start_codon:yes stop_codon:yes gene_type:complete
MIILMPVKSYTLQRSTNIEELRNTYTGLLDEYYELYQQYLSYKFSSNKNERKVETELKIPEYDWVGESGVASTPDPGFTSPCTGVCDMDYLQKVLAPKCTAMGSSCVGITNNGELKSVVPTTPFNITLPGKNGSDTLESIFHKKTVTTTTIIPAAKLAEDAAGKLEILKLKIASILNELKANIETTDGRLRQHTQTVDSKRAVILARNKKIQRQDRDLEGIQLKLISRRRQNEFSAERNRYRKVLLVLLVLCNVILIGYFGYLLTN